MARNGYLCAIGSPTISRMSFPGRHPESRLQPGEGSRADLQESKNQATKPEGSSILHNGGGRFFRSSELTHARLCTQGLCPGLYSFRRSAARFGDAISAAIDFPHCTTAFEWAKMASSPRASETEIRKTSLCLSRQAASPEEDCIAH